MSILKGEDVETKLRHAEVIIERLSRKSNVGMQTLVLAPQVFSAVHDVIEPGGALIRFMLPIDGVIKSCMFELGGTERDDDKKVADFLITIDSGEVGAVRKAQVKVGKDNIAVDLKLSAGTKVSVTAMTKVLDVWLALTFVPDAGERTVRQIALAMDKEASDEGVLSNP